MRGRAIPLSRPRRMVADLMYFAAGVPTVPVQRRMNLAPLVAARNAAADRPAWTAIFTKAYALVAADVPELRRAYVKFPWAHLYEYPASAAYVTVERDYGGEKAVFGYRVKDPAALSIRQLADQLNYAATAPVEEVKTFRRALAVAGYPRPVRRLLLWIALNVGRQRANYAGTFAVSVYSGLGAESLHPLSPWTTLLNYGVIAADGGCDVRVVYDHRVLDGANVARALAKLEAVLCGPVVAELRGARAKAA
jgi:pyruvate/2-oxoglutarate dehydrogenase complex dihydrolipoamide acyltransferase (E2) component